MPRDAVRSFLAKAPSIRRQCCRSNLGAMQGRDGLSPTLAHSEKLGRAFDPSVAYWRGYYARESDGSEPIGTERLRVFGDALTSVRGQGLWLEAGCGIGVIARQFR